MSGLSRNRKSYKKLLSMFELQALAEERKDSAVFLTNRKGERTLEPWLKELRFKQAFQVSEEILGEKINQQEFQDAWKRTRAPRKKKQQLPNPPNTATFGGYRLRDRSSLNRDQKKAPSQPKNYKK